VAIRRARSLEGYINVKGTSTNEMAKILHKERYFSANVCKNTPENEFLEPKTAENQPISAFCTRFAKLAVNVSILEPPSKRSSMIDNDR